MKKKCDKYEALFVFANETDFKEHLAECNDCSAIQTQMNKVSQLIKEVAPEYLAREKRSKFKKIASLYLFFTIGITGIIGYELNSYIAQNVGYSPNSIIYKQGLPVDDYGLLKI